MKAIALLALLACRLSCQAIDAKAQILATDAQYRDAVLRGDAAKLAIIFAQDILIVHSDGGTDTKANFLDAISSGRLKLTSYERSDVENNGHAEHVTERVRRLPVFVDHRCSRQFPQCRRTCAISRVGGDSF